MIKNVVFDIGNVLAAFAWEEFYKSFGYSEEVFEKMADATVRSEAWHELDRGILSTEEIIDLFVRNDPTIEKELRNTFKQVTRLVTRLDYAVPWICNLKEKGYRVFIISNFSERARQDCADALDFLPMVDGAILSYEDKIIKPNPAIYQLLCNRYQINASECVFIDDLPRNVEAAKKEGMQGIIFENEKQAKEELCKLL